MDRELLAGMLEEGMSLAAIGERVGRHESTVAYWARKHGLRAANADRHRARGAIGFVELRAMVDEGLSLAQMAGATGRSKATVRHWLRRHGLQTLPTGDAQRGGARQREEARAELVCARHGTTEFALEASGYHRCVRCRAEAVSRSRRRLKAIVVAEAGGECALCGYDRCMAALQFHHLERSEKSFALSGAGLGRSLAKAREEARKCVLLCSNCHAEVEVGFAEVGGSEPAGLQCTAPGVAPG